MCQLDRSTDNAIVERPKFAGSAVPGKCAAVFACLMVACVLAAGSATEAYAQSTSSAKPLSESEMTRIAPNDLARYVFENHGCQNCHTLGNNGKFGFTERGRTIGKNFEGCISLLTSMNVIAQLKEDNRTADEKQKAVRFKEFGCTECHQIVPGKMGLTKEGAHLKSLHMSCPDVQKLLTSK
jgi:hypothetical protein